MKAKKHLDRCSEETCFYYNQSTCRCCFVGRKSGCYFDDPTAFDRYLGKILKEAKG